MFTTLGRGTVTDKLSTLDTRDQISSTAPQTRETGYRDHGVGDYRELCVCDNVLPARVKTIATNCGDGGNC